MPRLAGKIALVTGGCGGIGAATAEALAREGAAVMIADLGEDPEVVRRVSAHGAPCAFHAVDVTSRASVESLMAATLSRFGGLDILVTVAGVLSTGPAATLAEGDFDRTLEVNLKGSFLCCQAAIGPMRQRGGGRIVTICSVLGKNGGNPRPWIDPAEQDRAGSIAYGMSKAGVHAMTLYLAKELARDGITVNCVAPGPIASAMTTSFPEALRNLIPVGRMGRAEEVARAVVYLADPDAGFVTGEIHDINGGIWLD